MKERPILFSGPMVRAILEGRKTMTRRVVKEWFLMDCPNYFDENNSAMNKPPHRHDDGEWYYETQTEVDSTLHCQLVCPYGRPGDRLWVRETMYYGGFDNFYFKADNKGVGQDRFNRLHALGKDRQGKVIPSIHMPRWASRITLEITEVRVERLKDISVEDCRREGVESNVSSLIEFHDLWNKINGKKYPWSSNPWVWVIAFKPVEKA